MHEKVHEDDGYNFHNICVWAEGTAFAASFKTQALEQKKVYPNKRVKDGTLSQERADAIYNAIEEFQSTCDGTGSTSLGAGCGAGIRAGGCGMGNNLGRESGRGMGDGLHM